MIRLSFVAVLCMVFITACTSENATGEYDVDELLAMRQEKDQQFREGDDSPIPADKRDSFTGLSYFEPNPDYVVSARFVESSSVDTISMQTSKDDVRKAARVGTFTFQLNGKNLKLAAYTFIGSDSDASYFVPFTDATTGHDTYYGGRYLDVPVQEDEDYVIDFNLAYNPYCAYNENYSCPLVPRENALNIAVRAGEKK